MTKKYKKSWKKEIIDDLKTTTVIFFKLLKTTTVTFFKLQLLKVS